MKKKVSIDKCPSCGIKYINHLGLIGTCRELQILKLGLLKLKKELYYCSNIEDAGTIAYREVDKLLNIIN